MKYVLVLIMLLMVGCAGIQEVTVIQTAPPNTGNADVQIGTQSTGKLLFEIKFSSGRTGGLPGQAMMDEMIAEGKRRGANVLLFECGAPGTVGASRCNMRGYLK
jgi:hypothetical protein